MATLTLIDNRMAPQNFTEAMELARWLAKSNRVPEEYQGQPENCLLAILWGAEVGLGALQAMSDLAFMDGRPALYGDAMLALVLGSGLCESFHEECDGKVAICRVRRKGWQVVERTFSVTDAMLAGLWEGSDAWHKYPNRMLQMRARAWALRDVFADVLRGVRSAEEVNDYAGREPSVQSAQQVQSPAAQEVTGVSPVNVSAAPAAKAEEPQPAGADASKKAAASTRTCPQHKFEEHFEKIAEILRTGKHTVEQCIAEVKKHGVSLTDEQVARLKAIENESKEAANQDTPQKKEPLKVVASKGEYPQNQFEAKLDGWVKVIISGRQSYENLLVFLNSRGTPLSDEQRAALKEAIEQARNEEKAA